MDMGSNAMDKSLVAQQVASPEEKARVRGRGRQFEGEDHHEQE
jgi:hypothetical protein